MGTDLSPKLTQNSILQNDVSKTLDPVKYGAQKSFLPIVGYFTFFIESKRCHILQACDCEAASIFPLC